MTEILLVRHGQTDWNAERRWQGHDDRPLNKLGRDQARELAGRLRDEPLEAIYTSDLRRARETAEILAARRDIEVHELPALREIDVGSWAGLTTAEIAELFPAQVDRMRDDGFGWEGGETPDQLTKRVVEAVRGIAAAHPGGRVLLVAHGGVIRVLGAVATGLGYVEYGRTIPWVGNCSVSRLACEDGGFRPLD